MFHSFNRWLLKMVPFMKKIYNCIMSGKHGVNLNRLKKSDAMERHIVSNKKILIILFGYKCPK